MTVLFWCAIATILITLSDLTLGQIKLDHRATSFFNKALQFENSGRKAEAIDLYKQALTIQNDLETAHQNLAMLYGELGDKQQARHHFNEAVKYAKTDHFKAGAIARHANFEMGLLTGKGKKSYSKVVSMLVKAKKALPPNIDLLQVLGMVYQRISSQENAKAAFEDILELEATHTFALLNVGNYFFAKEDYNQSAGYYTRALTHCPVTDNVNRISLLHNLAQSLTKLRKQYGLALSSFERALKVSR